MTKFPNKIGSLVEQMTAAYIQVGVGAPDKAEGETEINTR